MHYRFIADISQVYAENWICIIKPKVVSVINRSGSAWSGIFFFPPRSRYATRKKLKNVDGNWFQISRTNLRSIAALAKHTLCTPLHTRGSPSGIERIKNDFEDHVKRIPEFARSARPMIIDDRYRPRVTPDTTPEFTVLLCHLAQSLVHETFLRCRAWKMLRVTLTVS